MPGERAPQSDDERRRLIERALRAEFQYFGVLDEDGNSLDPDVSEETFRRLAAIILNKEAPPDDLYYAAIQRAYLVQQQKEQEGDGHTPPDHPSPER